MALERPALREALGTLRDAARVGQRSRSLAFPIFQLVDWLAAVEGTSPAAIFEYLDSRDLDARPKRWSVEVEHRGSYPRRGFWLDVTGQDEVSAVLVARAVLSELWGVIDPDAYEYRAVEVVDRRMEERS